MVQIILYDNCRSSLSAATLFSSGFSAERTTLIQQMSRQEVTTDSCQNNGYVNMYVHLETTCYDACEYNDRLNVARYLSEVERQFELSVLTGNEVALCSPSVAL